VLSAPLSVAPLLSLVPSADNVRPSLEAAARALNLVKTVFLIVGEYEYDKAQRWAVGRALLSADDGTARRLKLEEDVQRKMAELELAQAEYTGDGSGDVAESEMAEENGRELRQGRSANSTDHAKGTKSQLAKRDAVHSAASRLAEAEKQLDDSDESESSLGSNVHIRAASRLLKLCRENGGTYIKVGQHLANLDYLIPPEYIEALSSLFDDAPLTRYEDVREVIMEDLGSYPEDVFESFEEDPIASASLAQVHVARERGTGRKLAVKVQHRGLRETSKGDIMALTTAVRAVESLFPDSFEFGWLCDEIAPQLPRELDFVNEGQNSEKAADQIAKSGVPGLAESVVIPAVHWDKTTARVLTMDFEEGVKATNLDAMQKQGLRLEDVATLITSVFHAQVFLSGFVHCDPHPANVLIRSNGSGKPKMVLVDHGLYKKLDDTFRVEYCRLWKSLTVADIDGIKSSCAQLGIDEMYPLLAAMLTSRPFDEIIERSKSGSLSVEKATNANADKAMIRGYAQRFLADIIKMLDAVPRQMLLLFKMNDCLRHIDIALGARHADGLAIAGRYAARTIYEVETGSTHDGDSSRQPWLGRLRALIDYYNVLFRIQVYELGVWWIGRLQPALAQ